MEFRIAVSACQHRLRSVRVDVHVVSTHNPVHAVDNTTPRPMYGYVRIIEECWRIKQARTLTCVICRCLEGSGSTRQHANLLMSSPQEVQPPPPLSHPSNVQYSLPLSLSLSIYIYITYIHPDKHTHTHIYIYLIYHCGSI